MVKIHRSCLSDELVQYLQLYDVVYITRDRKDGIDETGCLFTTDNLVTWSSKPASSEYGYSGRTCGCQPLWNSQLQGKIPFDLSKGDIIKIVD